MHFGHPALELNFGTLNPESVHKEFEYECSHHLMTGTGCKLDRKFPKTFSS